jgi:DNA-directed RNA polymerase subunit RPC12/RpoP
MTTTLHKCSVCGAILDEEDLFCANCGTEAPSSNGQPLASKSGTVIATHNFLCDGCGAGMSYDASAQTLRCPFCGGEKLTEVKDVKVLSPQRVVPLKLDQRQAHAILQKWLPSGFWRPSDLVQQAVVEKMTPVYVPYWVFAADTFTYWTADTSQTPLGARGNWFPMSGEHRGRYEGLLIGASGSLTPGETSALCPFDLQEGVPPEQVDLNNVVYEPFQVQRKYARPLAQRGFEQLISRDCQQFVPGTCRNLKVNVRVENLSGEPVLLPVYIMAYRYKGHVYRFLVNGQTGRHTGTAPTSYFKIAAAIGMGLLIILAILVCMGLASAFLGR